MFCILVTGLPATGKSTLARELGRRLCLPVFSKDAIKERLFDDVGFSCREEKVKLGVAATMPLEDFTHGMRERGMDSFEVGGPRIVVDTTDFARVDAGEIAARIETWMEEREEI